MIKQIYSLDNEGGKLTITLENKDDGGLEVFFYDIGSAAKAAIGDADYEEWLNIESPHVGLLALHLLADRFGGSIHALENVRKYCDDHQISTTWGEWL